MADALDSLNGLMVPLADRGLLLPNVAVAELVAYRLTREAEDAPAWFLGWTRWRDQQVPLVDPYSLLELSDDPAGRQPRTLILNAIGGREGVHFIGVRVWGIPRSRKVLRGDISAADMAVPYVSQMVQLAGDATLLMIPDLEAIEQLLDETGLLRH